MTRFRIGIDTYPFNHKRNARLNLAELRVGLTAPPTPKVLRRWRGKAPDRVHFIWVANQHFTHARVTTGQPLTLEDGEDKGRFGHFQATEENARMWRETLEHAEALGAIGILFETPADFTPSPANKDRLRAFATGWSGRDEDTPALIWSPAGFWDREESIALTDELGFTLALDPLFEPDEPLPETDTAYFRMSGRVGIHNRYTADDLERLLDVSDAYETVQVVFSTRDAASDADQFARLVEQTCGPDALA